MQLHRHDLLRAHASAWAAMLQCRPDLADLPLVADWARLERPVIVRRRMACDSADGIPAALPLPPRYGKQRLAFSFASSDGVVTLPPVPLREAARAAPLEWHALIDSMLELGDASGIEPRVFGGLLWQHATALPYLSPESDLDLLWSVSDERTATSLAAELLRLDRTGPVRLDGELALPDGAAVNWRELACGSGGLLVKSMNGVEIRARAALFCPSESLS
jgi:phosphoribosyl-dephospho-CoA transferase